MINSVLACIVFFVCCLNATAQEIFVSSSSGNDKNDGLSELTPMKSIDAALKQGSDIKLMAGDTFYGNVDARNKNISRYGKGKNPVICGFKRIITPNWEFISNNIWRIRLDVDNFSGATAANKASLMNNVGCLYEYEKDIVHGRKVKTLDELKENWDFWQTDKFTTNDTQPSDFIWLYLYYSSGNPNVLKLEFSIGANGITADNTHLSHIDIKGFGRHGIAAGSNCLIEYCNIEVIGGAILTGYKNFVCFGNGIEFWVSKDIKDSEVRNCRVSRCLDCGMTIQGRGQYSPSNISIHHNLIENCCQGWEDFLSGDKTTGKFNNCRFSDNLLIDNGRKLCFGYPPSLFKYCQILGNNFDGDRGMIIENNTMIDGNYYCTGPYKGRYTSHIWNNNVCYLRDGMWILSNYGGTKDVLRVNAQNINEMQEKYRQLTTDRDTQFFIESEAQIEKIKKKTRKRFIKKNIKL